MKKILKKILSSKSPAYIQLIHLFNMLVIVLAGKIFFDLQISWLFIGGVILSSVAIDHTYLYLRDGKVSFFSWSSVITAIGFVALSYSFEFYVYPVILLVVLGQKYFLKIYNNKHIFNPSNLAVTLSFLMFPNVSVPVFDQWGGNNFWFLLIFISLAYYIVQRVNRIAIVLSFLISYILVFILFYFDVNNTVNYTEFFTKMFSGSFVIYSFFMLTDPRSTTSSKLFQILFGILITLHIFGLTLIYNMHQVNLFFGLTLTMIIFPAVESFSMYFFKSGSCSEKNIIIKNTVIIIIYCVFLFMMNNYFDNSLIFLKNN